MSADHRERLRALIVDALHRGDCHDHPISDHTEDVPVGYGQQADKVLDLFAEVRTTEWLKPGAAIVVMGRPEEES